MYIWIQKNTGRVSENSKKIINPRVKEGVEKPAYSETIVPVGQGEMEIKKYINTKRGIQKATKRECFRIVFQSLQQFPRGQRCSGLPHV